MPENASVLASFIACLELAISLPFSKRRLGLIGLAPTKVLKMVLASAAVVAACHADWLASAPDALEQGAQAARAAMGQASQADPSVGAVVMPGEAADAAAAPSPPDGLPTPASTPAEVAADLPVEPLVAADVGMVEAPPLAVVPDLPVPGHEERADTVAEVGDPRPATLAEGKPSALMAVVPDVLTAGGPDTLVEERAKPRPVLGAASSSPHSATPMSGVGRHSGSGATAPRNPSSSSTMSRRSSLGMSSMSMPRR
jgi:hypothetical protein